MDNLTKVTRSRFEIEQDGQLSYLEFETDGHGWMTIWHTEVAQGLRGKGIGLELVTAAFQYAKDNCLRVDVICPIANHLVEKHPEFKSLLGKR
jgi:predicted GNAT family acetyltransferase